jgi:hypothetical protein
MNVRRDTPNERNRSYNVKKADELDIKVANDCQNVAVKVRKISNIFQ